MTEEELFIIQQRLIGAAPAFAKKIAPIYKLLDWNWCDLENPPDEDQIYDHIVEYVNKLTTKIISIGSGGITVSIDDTDGIGIIGKISMDVDTEVCL